MVEASSGSTAVSEAYFAAMIGLPASLHPENAFMLAVWRVLEISLGILCSALVSALILPQSSSVPMRRMMHTRFRDFARFACDALAGNLDLERMEQVNARFAAVPFDGAYWISLKPN